MARISDEDIQRVRDASDIATVMGERVPLRQRGRDFWCCCPIHEEKSPSCKIDPASQLWHCFGCGAGGDVFSFIMQADGLGFLDAVRKLADRAHIEIVEADGRGGLAKGEKARLMEVCKETANFYHTQLMRSKDAEAAQAREYLGTRGLGGSVPKKWLLGFAPGRGRLVAYLRSKGFSAKEMVDANVALQGGGSLKDRFYNRIMFPILDAQGDCIAFGGRIIGQGQPKYLNSQETPIFHKSEVLYGLDKAKAAMAATGCAVVVEGYTDVIALHEAGVANAVATLGTALTGRHIRILSRHAQHRIVYLFDGDEAGQRAADRALSFIDENITPEAGRTKVEIAAAVLPDDLDPADFVAKNGGAALKKIIDEAKPLIAYGIERRLARYDLKSAENRSRALTDALSILAPIRDSLLAKDYAIQIAGAVRAREEDVLEKLSSLEPTRAYEAQEAGFPEGSPHAAPKQPREELPETELNRRRFEREFLSLCARYPALGLAHADTLAQTQWHGAANGLLAESLLDSLAANPAATPPELVTAAKKTVSGADGILTSGSMTDSASPEKLAVFLVEELSLGDMEDAITTLRQDLSRAQAIDPDEYEMMFASVVAMQKEFSRRKLEHKPLM